MTTHAEPDVLTVKTALAQLGVTETTLSDEQIAKLDADGFLVLRDLIGSGRLESMS